MVVKDLAVKVLTKRKVALPALDVRIACFREVLHANNTALGHLARIQQALAGEVPVGAGDVRSLVAGVTVQTYRMVSGLNRMTGGAHRDVVPIFERLKAAIVRKAEVTPTLRTIGMVVPLARVDASLAAEVGAKSAYLGEARQLLPAHVPAGFATTVQAYHAFMLLDDLGERVAAIVERCQPEDVAGCFAASATATQLIDNAPVPLALADAIERAVEDLPGGRSGQLAVRSSALHEGGAELSFAGQFRSFLNVRRAGVLEAFKRVVASKYSPQAITYWRSRGFADREVAMCCCVVELVDATAAGVLYSACETAAGITTLLQAVRGLGIAAVDGSAEPDSYLLDRRSRTVTDFRLGRQETLFQAAASEGTESLPVGPAASGHRVLTDAQALEVAGLAWALEDALGTPIDMEWALARDGRSYLLQARPQPPHLGEWRTSGRPRQGPVALLTGGSRASSGAGCGTVCRVDSDLDILRCPPSAVVVCHEASPRLAVLLPRAAALVADLGEVTGHLATVARELRVPALLATGHATTALTAGATVTVDADAGVVYEGRVEAVLCSPDTPPRRRDPHRELLASVAAEIVPLTLRDRLASGYSAKRCRTLHDIIRFCHQATVEAMFDLGDRALRGREPLHRLLSEVPIDCRLFDLGGGLRAGVGSGDVVLDDVTCRPMRSLWRGLIDPRLRWTTSRPVSLRGFMSAVVSYNFDQDSRTRSMGEPSYAFISADYLNLNSRIGYHFSTVDARVCEQVESNYASFRFVGGSTGIEQRSRRAVLIERLLAANGFETDCRADLVNARFRHRGAAEMAEALSLIGLLMGYVNHLDMALVSDEAMQTYEHAFLAGDYGFKGREGHGQPGS
jgi:pyruvate, water dikinase